jgi:hypothetical protein
VRGLALALAAFGLLAACDQSAEDVAAGAATESGSAEPEAVAGVDEMTPYAGQWAAERHECGDDRQLWTIETHRMGIRPALRFCAFEDIFVSKETRAGEATWSAEATCMAEGEESRAFVFFRVKDNLSEMRVTFNDTASVDLVRCPMAS